MYAELDVVVPVYNAFGDLVRCVSSVLARSSDPFRLWLIDDASTDPRVGDFLASLAGRGDPRVRVLRNEQNLGFVGTCNRAFAVTAGDVVLLNSDAVVTDGWLDKIRRCAASDARIATITPFSNNAEICSFPRLCVDNEWHDEEASRLANRAIESAAVPIYPDIPTAVGFCMYIRRSVLDAFGGFDPTFAPGYGEENDLCMRAAKAGWRNVLLDDTYVVHCGGRSFSESKRALQERNLKRLVSRHPEYQRVVSTFIADDPIAPIRAWAETRRAMLERSGQRGVLHVIHADGGGTERHVRDLVDALCHEFRGYLLTVGPNGWRLEDLAGVSTGDRAERQSRTFALSPSPGESAVRLLGGLCASLDASILHAHNISGSRDELLRAIPAIGVAFGYTFHDLGFACPTITMLAPDGEFCGGETDADRCQACLSAQSGFRELDVRDWRARHQRFVAAAEFLIAPSQWAGELARRYFGPLDVDVVPHGVHPLAHGGALPWPTALGLPDDDVPTVAVVGAIGPDKGARRLEALVDATRRRRLPLRWVLIGYMDCEHGPHQDDDAVFTVHGRYQPEQLPDLFARYRVRAVLFPSAGPETFSYTLSEAWQCGLPVLVPPFGALAERVGGTGGGWVLDAYRDVDAILEQVVGVVSAADGDGWNAVAARVAAIELPTLAQMARRTADVYRRIAPSSSAMPALANRRMVDAAGRATGRGRATWRELVASSSATMQAAATALAKAG